MLELSDQDLISRLKDTEDSFVERKTVNDRPDCLKTVVAFANTAPVGYPAILFVGVRDDGEIEDNETDFDRFQKNLSDDIAKAYPSIYTAMRVLKQDGRQFLAVLIPGSENRPHFAGPAYVRDGAKSIVASREQFERVISQRSGKTYEILKWRGKGVTLTQIPREHMLHGSTQWAYEKQMLVNVHDCNLHYVTLGGPTDPRHVISYPLSLIELNYDNPKERLELRLLEGTLPPWPVSI